MFWFVLGGRPLPLCLPSRPLAVLAAVACSNVLWIIANFGFAAVSSFNSWSVCITDPKIDLFALPLIFVSISVCLDLWLSLLVCLNFVLQLQENMVNDPIFQSPVASVSVNHTAKLPVLNMVKIDSCTLGFNIASYPLCLIVCIDFPGKKR